MSDSLFMPLPQRASVRRELTGWEAVWMPLGEGEAERLTIGRGTGWKPIEVPRQLAATEGRQSIWYRTEFPRPDHAGRVVLRIGGAFLATNVWLNGRLLGSHYGYFAPFGFDLTPYLKPENLLVICCESPVEGQPEKKRHIMGLFNDGDLKPYPASAYSSLPEPYRLEVPLGLWQPVQLEYVGPIGVDWLRLRPSFEAGDGRLEVEARLRNLDGRQMEGEVELAVPIPGREPLKLRREIRLGGGMEQTVAMRLAFPGAKRWEPWRFGKQHVYRAEVIARAADGGESCRIEDGFAFRELSWDIGPRRWSFSVNGRPMFLRGACYAPSYRLDELTPELFASDIATAKAANLDALRVTANVLPPDFYRLADEAGLLVFQDLPLTGTYVYHGRNDEARFFENAARAQQAEMVTMLQNHPSIVLWIAHDDPPWLATNFDLGDVHSVRQNHSIDQELKSGFEHLDPGRPAVAGSGDVDLHLMAGWSNGSWRDIGLVEPLMVTAFGAQSLPGSESKVWDAIGKRWPVADDDPAWRHAGFQPVNWAERGVGLPSAHQSLEHYAVASQLYQARLLRYAAEHMRTRKFEACWGAFAFHLVDPFPGIGFGVLDATRHPKLALEELATAFKATRLIIEPLAFEAGRPFGFVQDPRTPFAARLVIVNDDPEVKGRGIVRWTVSRKAGGARGLDRMRDVVQKKSYSGSIEVEVPTAFEPAVSATTLSLPLAAEGEYRMEASLTVSGREVDITELTFLVTSTQAPVRQRPEIPRYLAERLADLQSLRAESQGMSIGLENRTRPAVLAGITGLRLDGVLVTGHQLQIETNAGLAPLPRRLDMPLGRRLVIHVVTGTPLGAGAHSLEADVTVPGVASGRLVIENGPKPHGEA